MIENNSAPYAPPENVLRVLDRVHRSGLRGKIDVDFLGQLGIGDGMVTRTLRALEFLGFTQAGDEGAPTPLLEQYIVSGESDAQALLAEAIRKSYDAIFRAVDPISDDRAKVQTAFKVMKPQGQWARMTTLFLGLCQAAGIPVKDAPFSRPGKDQATQPNRKARVRTKLNAQPRQQAGPPAQAASNSIPVPSRTIDPALVGIIGKVAELETLDDLEAWIAMFRAAFQFVKKIKKGNDPRLEPEGHSTMLVPLERR